MIVEPSDPYEPGEALKFISKVEKNFSPITSERSSLNLIACATRFGLLFTSDTSVIKVFQTKNLIDKQDNTPLVEIEISENCCISHLSVNCDGLTLLVVASIQNNPYVLFFDCCNISTAVPFYSAPLSPKDGSFVTSLVWNPTDPTCLAVALSTGDLTLINLKENSVQYSTKEGIGAWTVGWSAKGKQLAVGKQDGSLSLYKCDLTLVRNISGPPIENVNKVISITWFTNTEFFVGYNIPDGIVLCYVNAPKDKEATYCNFDDICFSNEDSKQIVYYNVFLPEWNLLLVFSSRGIEMGVLGKGKGPTQSSTCQWTQWYPEEDSRATMQFINVVEETYPLGLCIDFTVEKLFPSKDESSRGPFPVLMTLSTGGEINIFHIENKFPDAVSLCKSVEPLPLSSPRTSNQYSQGICPYIKKRTETAVSAGFETSATSSSNAGKPPLVTNIGAPGAVSGSVGAPFSSIGIPFTASSANVGTPFSALSTSVASPFTATSANVGTPFSALSTSVASPFTATSANSATLFAATSSNSGTLFAASSGAGYSVTSTPSTVSAAANIPPQNVAQDKSFVFSTPVKPVLPQQPSLSMTPVTPFVTTYSSNLSTPTLSTMNSASDSLVPDKKVAEKPFQVTKAEDNVVKANATVVKPKPVTPTSKPRIPNDILIPLIAKEIAAFEKGLKKHCLECENSESVVGTKEEVGSINRNLKNIAAFFKESQCTTEDQTNEINQLHQGTMDAFAIYEDANAHFTMKRNKKNSAYLQLRPLDPYSRKRLEEIRSKYFYLKTQIADVNMKLDMEWEDYCTKKKSRKWQSSITGDALHRSILNLHNLRTSHEKNIDMLSEQMKKLLNTSIGGKKSIEGDPFDKEAACKVLSPMQHNLPPQKVQDLQRVLLKRNTTPVRSRPVSKITLPSNKEHDISLPEFPQFDTTQQYEDISAPSSPEKVSSNPLAALSSLVGKVDTVPKPTIPSEKPTLEKSLQFSFNTGTTASFSANTKEPSPMVLGTPFSTKAEGQTKPSLILGESTHVSNSNDASGSILSKFLANSGSKASPVAKEQSDAPFDFSFKPPQTNSTPSFFSTSGSVFSVVGSDSQPSSIQSNTGIFTISDSNSKSSLPVSGTGSLFGKTPFASLSNEDSKAATSASLFTFPVSSKVSDNKSPASPSLSLFSGSAFAAPQTTSLFSGSKPLATSSFLFVPPSSVVSSSVSSISSPMIKTSVSLTASTDSTPIGSSATSVSKPSVSFQFPSSTVFSVTPSTGIAEGFSISSVDSKSSFGSTVTATTTASAFKSLFNVGSTTVTATISEKNSNNIVQEKGTVLSTALSSFSKSDTLFAAPSVVSSSSSLFGGGITITPTTSSGGLFSSNSSGVFGQSTKPETGISLFPVVSVPASTLNDNSSSVSTSTPPVTTVTTSSTGVLSNLSTSGMGLFTSPLPASSAPTKTLFGSVSSSFSTVSTTTPATLGENGQLSSSLTSGASIFSTVSTPSTQSSIFSGNSAFTTSAGVFGGTPSSGSVGFNTGIDTKSLFSGATTTSSMATASSSSAFGSATTTSTGSSLFGGPTVAGNTTFNTGADTKSLISAATTTSITTASSGSAFGSITTTSAGSSLFGGPTVAGNTTFNTGADTKSLFSGMTTTSSITTASSGSAFGSVTTTSAGSSLFGGSTVAGNTSSLFAAVPSSETTGSVFGGPAFGKGQSLFGVSGEPKKSLFGNEASSTPAFGGGSSGTTAVFGNTSKTSSLFGSAVSTSSTTSPVFGGNQGSAAVTTTASSMFGSSQGSVFGNTQSSSDTSVFGNTSSGTGGIFGNSQAPSAGVFGNTQASAALNWNAENSLFAGTCMFSELGGTASKENASKNVFGEVSSSSQPPPDIFGNKSASAFGTVKQESTSSPFSPPPSTGSFSPIKTNTAAFGSAPTFGGAPAFGSKFGAPAVFGGGPTFGSSPPGAAPTFGSSPPGAAPTFASSPPGQTSGGFSSFAGSGKNAFGSLASNSPSRSVFGGQSQESATFGGLSQSSTNNFGSVNLSGNSFTSWRS